MTCVLMLGSGPNVTEAARWPRAPFDHVVAINNAHAVRPDWTHHIYPWDFPEARRGIATNGQAIITEDDFVPAQNAFGGFVYAGGTMAFTTAYWALHALKPRVIAAFGCDMHYPKGQTHFYGTGTADPLRPDITLQSLEAKSARLMILAAMEGCAMLNLSFGPSRLIFPRVPRDRAAHARPLPFDLRLADEALKREDALGYHVPSGRYWEEADRFDPAELRRLDMLWLAAARTGLAATA
ncbi:MAG: hypothetical protein O9292_15050 [Rhodobacteraceae bacterium]|jgi:hypothetical protein|nr:hypothetical protein [Paracoccaceae bacterium]